MSRVKAVSLRILHIWTCNYNLSENSVILEGPLVPSICARKAFEINFYHWLFCNGYVWGLGSSRQSLCQPSFDDHITQKWWSHEADVQIITKKNGWSDKLHLFRACVLGRKTPIFQHFKSLCQYCAGVCKHANTTASGCPGAVPRANGTTPQTVRHFHHRAGTCHQELGGEAPVSGIFKQGLQRDLLTWMP